MLTGSLGLLPLHLWVLKIKMVNCDLFTNQFMDQHQLAGKNIASQLPILSLSMAKIFIRFRQRGGFIRSISSKVLNDGLRTKDIIKS